MVPNDFCVFSNMILFNDNIIMILRNRFTILVLNIAGVQQGIKKK